MLAIEGKTWGERSVDWYSRRTRTRTNTIATLGTTGLILNHSTCWSPCICIENNRYSDKVTTESVQSSLCNNFIASLHYLYIASKQSRDNRSKSVIFRELIAKMLLLFLCFINVRALQNIHPKVQLTGEGWICNAFFSGSRLGLPATFSESNRSRLSCASLAALEHLTWHLLCCHVS